MQTEPVNTLQQAKDVLQAQLDAARQTADVGLQSRARKQELKEAVEKASLAQQQSEALQQSLDLARADQDKTDKVCPLITHCCLTECKVHVDPALHAVSSHAMCLKNALWQGLCRPAG